jgi:hypothetical protein
MSSSYEVKLLQLDCGEYVNGGFPRIGVPILTPGCDNGLIPLHGWDLDTLSCIPGEHVGETDGDGEETTTRDDVPLRTRLGPVQSFSDRVAEIIDVVRLHLSRDSFTIYKS